MNAGRVSCKKSKTAHIACDLQVCQLNIAVMNARHRIQSNGGQADPTGNGTKLVTTK